jgi:hypothetical protein
MFIFISHLFTQQVLIYNCGLAKNKAKQFDTYNNTVTHGINKHTVNNTAEENLYTVSATEVR